MSKEQQRKGRAGEIELASLLREYGIPANPGQALNFGTIPDVVGAPGIHCEVKRVERLNVPEAMGQATRDAEKFGDGFPTLFHRRNRSPWLVTMRFQDWIWLYMKWTKTSAYYVTCPICGANLDPGERCDCEVKDDKERTREVQGKNNDQRNPEEELSVCPG